MKTIPSLAGKVTVVTGASRGVGAGIATLLGEQGATVYVTGRTTASKPGTTPGTISEVADSITRAGGVGITVVCDHVDDAQIKALFELGIDQSRVTLYPAGLLDTFPAGLPAPSVNCGF